MALFQRNGGYRLKDKEKERKPVRYHPPRPLSWLSCVLLLVFAVMLLYYGGSLVLMRFFGTETLAQANTVLDENGQPAQVEVKSYTNMIDYTYQDQNGTWHEHTDSLLGNEEEWDETISVRYFPAIPGWSVLAFRTRELTTPLLCMFLGVILVWTGVSRLLFLRRKALGLLTEEEAKKEEAHEKASARNRD